MRKPSKKEIEVAFAFHPHANEIKEVYEVLMAIGMAGNEVALEMLGIFNISEIIKMHQRVVNYKPNTKGKK